MWRFAGPNTAFPVNRNYTVLYDCRQKLPRKKCRIVGATGRKFSGAKIRRFREDFKMGRLDAHMGRSQKSDPRLSHLRCRQANQDAPSSKRPTPRETGECPSGQFRHARWWSIKKQEGRVVRSPSSAEKCATAGHLPCANTLATNRTLSHARACYYPVSESSDSHQENKGTYWESPVAEAS